MSNRRFVQALVGSWARRCFGSASMTTQERASRVLEEALELAQAAGVGFDKVEKLATYVYHRPVGEVAQEMSGVAVTLLVMAEALGIDLDHLEQEEIARILGKDTAHWKDRVKNKAEAGVAVYSDD